LDAFEFGRKNQRRGKDVIIELSLGIVNKPVSST